MHQLNRRFLCRLFLAGGLFALNFQAIALNTFCGDARAAAAIFNRMDPVLRNAVEAGALFGARENLGDHDLSLIHISEPTRRM